MKRPMHFIIPGPPVPKGRPRLGHGRRIYTPPKTANYEAWVRVYALQAKVRPVEGPVYMALDFYLENRRTKDLDNLAKAILDALNGVAYRDDNQVKEVRMRKRLDRDNPRTEVEFYAHPETDGWA
jgi:crossover junction endodeoxyribonuclease RusA